MELIKFKCSSCGSTQYEKITNGYKCKYCGNIQDVIFKEEPKKIEPEVKTEEKFEEKGINQTEAMSSEGVDNKEFGSILLRLILCLLAGGLGIHKFVEGKILMGFVYILTFGLCYIGVIVDIVTYVSKLVEINKEKAE